MFQQTDLNWPLHSLWFTADLKIDPLCDCWQIMKIDELVWCNCEIEGQLMRSSSTLRSTFLSDLALTALMTGNLTCRVLSLDLYNEMFHATFCCCLSFSFLISVLPNFPSKDQICLFLSVSSSQDPVQCWPPHYNYSCPLATLSQPR